MTILHTQYFVDANGKRKGVYLSIRQYQKLVEDLHDLAVVAERRHEKPMNFNDVKRRLKKDDIL